MFLLNGDFNLLLLLLLLFFRGRWRGGGGSLVSERDQRNSASPRENEYRQPYDFIYPIKAIQRKTISVRLGRYKLLRITIIY